MSKPKYVLHYFNLRARAEFIRVIFAAAGVQYEDHRIEMPDWPNHKASVFYVSHLENLLLSLVSSFYHFAL